MGAHTEAFRQTYDSSSSNDGEDAENEVPTATDCECFIGIRTNWLLIDVSINIARNTKIFTDKWDFSPDFLAHSL